MSTKNNEKIAEIGARIRLFRKGKNLTLVQFADLIGISHGSLSSLENNRSKPAAETLSNLCLYTDIDIEWLLTGESKERGSERKSETFFSQLQDWGKEMAGSENIDWMKRQIEAQFPAFKKWKEAKEESERGEDIFPSSKVA
ncbi:helix-turn-helix transcriptional regulator [uncultured Desulfobulbus sp.]|uniref:helix-turn-helix domain-containing protein n=1 Tax=uncultured Desulfobulbus sp. TaxID=239745 RepID=UPI0029C6232A|nr:helix-turn-helix transcriptional regulator [uncultured Desulfobulbus sp.]